ncbi:MAG: FlgD immunoglobulin-like domain containing protein [Bacteroidota bacterium]
MSRRSLFLALAVLLPVGLTPAIAQDVPRAALWGAMPEPTEGILRNSISNLFAVGDSLWVGPFLNLTTDGGQTWQVADTDSLFGSRNRVFSIDVEGDVIWVGLGYTGREDQFAAGGFLVSRDGGQTFAYRFDQLDAPGDSILTYGVSTLRALPIITQEQSPPFDIDYDPVLDEVWVAGFGSGIRRSRDGGATWDRIILPPDGFDAISPDEPYDFFVEPARGETGFLNYNAFSVLVDEEGVVWAGTSEGVNRSRPEDLDAATGDRGWQLLTFDGGPNALVGKWTVSIEEQPLPGRNPIWFANWAANRVQGEAQRFGLTVTRDGGETFEQVLTDVETIDFAFAGERVYVAGRSSGLFISDDAGRTWRSVGDFFDPTQPDRIVRQNVDVAAVATTRDAVWIGTSDGLLRSTDGGQTWRLFRAEVPLNPDTPTDDVPRVDTYAYPNPFSPAASGFVRVHYALESDQTVRVRIFDFGMNLVRDLVNESQPAGTREAPWDGTDNGGLRVANGPYFYAVEANGETVWGKILLIE